MSLDKKKVPNSQNKQCKPPLPNILRGNARHAAVRAVNLSAGPTCQWSQSLAPMMRVRRTGGESKARFHTLECARDVTLRYFDLVGRVVSLRLHVPCLDHPRGTWMKQD